MTEFGGQHAQRRSERGAVFFRLDHGGHHALDRVQLDAGGEIFERHAPFGQEAEFNRGQLKLVAKFRIGLAQFARHAVEGGIDGQTGFGADDQEVECVGQPLADRGGALLHLVVDEDVRGFVGKQQRDREGEEPLHRPPFRLDADAIEQQGRCAADDDRHDHAAKDDGDGHVL